jgi:molybdopterin-guanine dinucleotide biosynthesis protein A
MGFVLAGGKSSRMGANKAFLEIGGQTLLRHALATLRGVCDHVAIVGDPATFVAHGPVIADSFAECGPLAGIHAALSHSSAELNVILAVDMPFVSTELLGFLVAAAGTSDGIVTVARTGRGFQPLCAVYRRDFAAVAEQALRAGKYKIDSAFATVRVRVIEVQELAAAGFSENNFFNVNTPEERRAADTSKLGS